MASIDDLVAAVAKETSDAASLVALLVQVKAALVAALANTITPEQQAKIDQVFSDLSGNDQAIADALAANVP